MLTQEPPSKEEAHCFVGRRVSKQFVEGLFHGTVTEVDTEQPFYFQINYDDGDEETVEWEELITIMQSTAASKIKREPEGPKKRTKSLSGRADHDLPHTLPHTDTGTQAAAPSASNKRQRKQQEAQPAEASQHHSHSQQAAAGPACSLARALTSAGPAARAAAPSRAGPGEANDARERMAGHLDKILIENFMCHEKFEMTFGPHVTLVSGTNGSGKSAVMQGLQACLGVTARKTGRATNLSSFIRTGSHEARLQVTVFNAPDDDGGFEFKTFGKRIIFDRRLTRGSGGHFKVLNAAGKAVPEYKPQQVLRYLGVNAANPLTIITQDMARSFLSGAADDKKRKYEMFMQGTMLEEIREELAGADSNVSNSQEQLKHLNAELLAQQQEMQEVKERLDKLKELDRTQKVCGSMDTAMVWATVWQERESVENLRSQVEGLGPQRQQELHRAMEEATASLKQAEQEENDVIAALNASNEAARNANADLKRLKDNHKECHAARRLLESQKGAVEQSLEELRQTKEEYVKVLNEDKGERAQQQREAMEELEHSTAALREALQEATEALASSRLQSSALLEEIKQGQNRQDALRQDVHSYRAQAQTCSTQLREHEASAHNHVLKFGGAAVVRLLNLIQQRQHEFERRPIGPVGAYLTLTDSKWSLAVQAAIGGLLSTFLCHTMKDLELLKQLAVQAGLGRLTVVRYNYNMTPHSNQPSFRRTELTAVMDVLSVTDPGMQTILMNYLVDMAHVEKTVLTQSEAEARNNLYSRRVQRAYSASGMFFNLSGTSQSVRGYEGGQATLGMNDAQIRLQLEEALANAQASAHAAEQSLASVTSQVAGLKAQHDAMQKQQTAIGKRKTIAKANLDAKQHELLQQQQGPLSQLSADDEQDEVATQVQACQGNILNTQVELDDLEVKLREAKAAEAEAKRLYDQRKEMNAQRGEAPAAFAAELDKLGLRKAKQQTVVKDVGAKLAATAVRLDGLKAALQKKEEELSLMQQTAEGVDSEEQGHAAMAVVRRYTEECVRSKLAEKRRKRDPTVVNMSELEVENAVQSVLAKHLALENLERERTRLAATIDAVHRSAGGNRDEVEAQYERLEKKNAKLLAKVHGTRSMLANLRHSWSVRQEKYKDLQDGVIRIADNQFNRLMKRRHHLGNIAVCDERKELTLSVKVKGFVDGESQAVTDLKQLSGGERSYTTIAFLMALGEHTESPFRCMDEFDVYMDAINRRVATETLLEFAHEDSGHQYIFLTPQDIQAVNDAKATLEQRLQREGKLEGPIDDKFLKTVVMRPARP